MTRAQTDISRSPGKSLISLFPASVSSPHCLKINAPAHTMAHPGSIAVSFRQHPASAHHAVADSSPPHSTNGGRAELPLWTTMQTASTRDEWRGRQYGRTWHGPELRGQMLPQASGPCIPGVAHPPTWLSSLSFERCKFRCSVFCLPINLPCCRAQRKGLWPSMEVSRESKNEMCII
jgi:hypothetical protein